jgi:hypothetical protein
MTVDHHTLAAIALTGTALNLLGGLYLAYDLFGGKHGPLRTLTRAVTYGLMFFLGYVAFLPLRTERSRADSFVLAIFLVGLIRRASIGSPCVETAINHASSPNSRPLAGLLSPNT